MTVRATSPRVPFSTVLVANRGEIACRVIRTLGRIGIRSVAVYSDADAGAKHVREADAAVRIGPATASASYLDIDAIVEAARRTGADAVHPGYGFLSENPEFARACADAGIVFVGPPVGALEVMGDKVRSKAHVAEHGVPIVVGVADTGLDDEELAVAADRIGYPILVKPSAGGGGKGMGVVDTPDALPDALATARRIARTAFGDDTLLLESLIQSPRHIEVQVLADDHGGVVHLGERECSLQRRHQKVIEEAPSPIVDEATRARLGEAACAVARSVDYRGAGTVEFLVPAATPDRFFFIEMNARLQVEHPVTEQVTGVDLVEWQLRIAAGEPLGFVQADVTLTGHAVEARVYAEQPERGFLPSTGRVLALREPAGSGIRVDSGLLTGLDVTADYDPMLAKVIGFGPDRATALDRLDHALREMTVLGLQTNLEYLRLLLADVGVRAGDLDTGLIERRLPELRFRSAEPELLIAAALILHRDRVGSTLWDSPSGWRLGRHRPTTYRFADGWTGEVAVLGPAEAATVTIDGREYRASLKSFADDEVLVEVDDRMHRITTARTGDEIWVARDGVAIRLQVRSRADLLAESLAGRERTPGAVDSSVRSPMPGTVVAVHAATGDVVTENAALVTVEAMKMEHSLRAPLSGTVTIDVRVGDLVKPGQVLADVAEAEAAPSASSADPASTGPATSDPAPIHTAPTSPTPEERP